MACQSRRSNGQQVWHFQTDDLQEQTCSDKINTLLNKLDIGASLQYKIGIYSYVATKIQSTQIHQTNLTTNKKRLLYIKPKQHIANTACFPSVSTYTWAFMDDDNVLIALNSQYQTFLDVKLQLNRTKNYILPTNRFEYSVTKTDTNEAIQTNNKTKKNRKLFKVLNASNGCCSICTTMGVEMIKELFYRTIDQNDIKISSIEKGLILDKR